jgi:putative spermidine/putrescine transport system substrate-binding protein
MSILPTETLFRKITADPGAFDVVQVEAWMIEELSQRDLIQPIPATSIERFAEIEPVFTQGKVDGRPVGASGTPPWKVIFADHSRSTAAAWLNAVPTVCNADTLAWRADSVARPVESWAALVLPENGGRVAMADVPAVSHVELSLALQARELVTYADIGDQSADEIDATYNTLKRLGKGHFHSVWSSYETSVQAMASGAVSIQSCWPPAVTALSAKGIPVRYTQLKEGARGWAGGFVLMRDMAQDMRDSAMAYMNWYLNGWAGAYLMRQGYYSSTPKAARAHMREEEWDYWYHGAPAATPVRGPDGRTLEKAGTRRDGGSFSERMGHIACWNTRMSEDARIRKHWAALTQELRG